MGALGDLACIPGDPFAAIRQETMFAYMEDLTAIQPYSGWRNSGTEGEAEALDYVAAQMQAFAFLENMGLEVERQQFNVFMTTELWETQLWLTMNGAEVEVPADGLRGPRDDIPQALRFDSDGVLNDNQRDPATAQGETALLRSTEDLDALDDTALRGKIAFLDYALIDRALMPSARGTGRVEQVLAAGRRRWCWSHSFPMCRAKATVLRWPTTACSTLRRPNRRCPCSTSAWKTWPRQASLIGTTSRSSKRRG
jgi:hypothetical protein